MPAPYRKGAVSEPTAVTAPRGGGKLVKGEGKGKSKRHSKSKAMRKQRTGSNALAVDWVPPMLLVKTEEEETPLTAAALKSLENAALSRASATVKRELSPSSQEATVPVVRSMTRIRREVEDEIDEVQQLLRVQTRDRSRSPISRQRGRSVQQRARTLTAPPRRSQTLSLAAVRSLKQQQPLVVTPPWRQQSPSPAATSPARESIAARRILEGPPLRRGAAKGDALERGAGQHRHQVGTTAKACTLEAKQMTSQARRTLRRSSERTQTASGSRDAPDPRFPIQPPVFGSE